MWTTGRPRPDIGDGQPPLTRTGGTVSTLNSLLTPRWVPAGGGSERDPVGDAGDVAGQSGQGMPAVRLWQGSVASAAQAAGADVLGEGGFDAGADR